MRTLQELMRLQNDAAVAAELAEIDAMLDNGELEREFDRLVESQEGQTEFAIPDSEVERMIREFEAS